MSEAFLKKFHRAKPSCTSRNFTMAKNSKGQTSYHSIVETLQAHRSEGPILDLACGDGFLLEKLVDAGWSTSQLFGLDMSEEELRVAKSRPVLSGVDLQLGNARQLPYGSQKFSAVSCHLALMLMPNVAEVILEISRVLKKKGVFVAIVSKSLLPSRPVQFYRDHLNELLHQEGQDSLGALGDPAVNEESGLHSLFSENMNFSRLELSDEMVELRGSPTQLADSMLELYGHFMLSETGQIELHRRLCDEWNQIESDHEQLSYQIGLRKIVAFNF